VDYLYRQACPLHGVLRFSKSFLKVVLPPPLATTISNKRMLAFKSRSTRCNSHNGLAGVEKRLEGQKWRLESLSLSNPPPFCWCPCERKERKKTCPAPANDGPCVYFWGWPTGLMCNKRAAIHQDDTPRRPGPRALLAPPMHNPSVYDLHKESLRKQQIRPVSYSDSRRQVIPFFQNVFYYFFFYIAQRPLRINAASGGDCASFEMEGTERKKVAHFVLDF
jgi:hypothetical protein